MDNDKTVLVNFGGDMSLDELYLELGKAYYEGGFEDPLPELLPLFDRITRMKNGKENEAEIQKLPEEQDWTERGESGQTPELGTGREEQAQFCANCGAKLEMGAAFCGSCGCKVR